jgi:hypothetical protein
VEQVKQAALVVQDKLAALVVLERPVVAMI